jgi:hypothetical protein
MASSPAALEIMMAAWNTRDEARMRALVDEALTPDVVFCDPHYDIVGREAFVEMVLVFFKKYAACDLMRTSQIDLHHNRARYSWAIVFPDGRRFDGFDAVRLDEASGKVARVDGFFGPLKPV